MEVFLSIVGTALFGLLFYFLTIRKNTIKHFRINSYEIGRGLKDEFPKLNISYDNKEIENNFIVLKGGFINCGWDIKGDDIEFDMILPETCNIVDVNIKSSDDNLVVTPSIIDKNKLHYKIEKLILHDDIFFYSLIVESSKGRINRGELSFYHRIYKTKKIRNMRYDTSLNWIFAEVLAFLSFGLSLFALMFLEDDYISLYNIMLMAAVLFFLFIVTIVIRLPNYLLSKKISKVLIDE